MFLVETLWWRATTAIIFFLLPLDWCKASNFNALYDHPRKGWDSSSGAVTLQMVVFGGLIFVVSATAFADPACAEPKWRCTLFVIAFVASFSNVFLNVWHFWMLSLDEPDNLPADKQHWFGRYCFCMMVVNWLKRLLFFIYLVSMFAGVMCFAASMTGQMKVLALTFTSISALACTVGYLAGATVAAIRRASVGKTKDGT